MPRVGTTLRPGFRFSCRHLQEGDFVRAQHAPFSWPEIPEVEPPDAGTNQSFDFESERVEHAADLTIVSLLQHDGEPARRNRVHRDRLGETLLERDAFE